ncbi:hypothetical protein B0H19DRAFT_1061814 [Mycena capillaripes]|nr:hypothetical protein B0H19DRAFT_1061814 [Mycena capillaripes]
MPLAAESPLDAAQGTSSPVPSSPTSTPPPPVGRHASDSATPSVSEPAPAPRKSRLEADPTNVINEQRARKVRLQDANGPHTIPGGRSNISLTVRDAADAAATKARRVPSFGCKMV